MMYIFNQKALTIANLIALCALPSACNAPSDSKADGFDTAPWVEDYVALRDFASVNYANLDWALEANNINPVSLNAETLAALDEAKSDEEARAILKAFLEDFRDGHVRLKVPRQETSDGRTEAEAKILDSSVSPAAACKAMGVEEGRTEALRFGLLSGDALPEGVNFEPLPETDNSYAGGILTVDGREFGLVRIPIFMANWHMGACERSWAARQAETMEPCDEGCQSNLLYFDAGDRLLAEFNERLLELSAQGISRIIVDITKNGGGTDWVDPMVRMIGGENLVCAALKAPRNEFWDENFSSMLSDVTADLEGAPTDEEAAILRDAKERLETLRDEARTRCENPNGVWTDENAACVRLTTSSYSACGVFDRPPAVDITSLTSIGTLFNPLHYTLPEAPQFDERFLLIDGSTGSAAEVFAAMLQDNDAATLLGKTTYGAGCGYVNGGSVLTLPNSKMVAHFPNCQRLRRDGSNEVEGVKPDVVIDWKKDDAVATQLRKLVDALRRL